MKPRKICFYSVASHLGGAERSLLDLVAGLREHSHGRYEPHVLLPSAEGPLVQALREHGISHSVLAMPAVFFTTSRTRPWRAVARAILGLPPLIAYVASLRTELRRIHADALHSNGIKCHLISSVAAPRGFPIFWHLRDWIDSRFTRVLLKSRARRRVSGIIANSQATARRYDPKLARLSVIPNGIPDFALAPKTGTPRLRIGILGVLTAWKGQMQFLEMARALLEAGLEADFFVYGGPIYDTETDRDYPATLRRRAIELKLGDRLRFMGYVAQPETALQNLDILVHASTRPEPFGRVLIEAFAAGVPVVASAAGGVTEIVTHEENGLLYPLGDSSSMTAAVRRLANDPILRARLVEAGRRRYESEFTLEKHLDRMIEFYDQNL